MSRLPEPPFGALVGHSDDRRGRSRLRDPPEPLSWGPKRRMGVAPGPERNRKRLRPSEVGHEYGEAVGRIA
jgi:hypothetical protein